MWQAAGNAARAAGRFARRHRRAIVVGGVVGAAACVYHSMKKALKEAEEEHAAMLMQARDDSRRRQCLSRTREESVAALTNFLPALRKRLFLAVDVTGPVRELKALRTGGDPGAAMAGAGGGAGAGAGSSGGDSAAVDTGSASAATEATDVQSREVELWDKVKVTALTRLVVSLYAFSALALMLHVQLHILGRLSFEESRELLQGGKTATASGNHGNGTDSDESATPPSDGNPRSPVSAAAASSRHTAETTARGATRLGDGGGRSSGGGGTAGLALSMEARHALLSATYEHVLGDGLRALVRDVQRAVSRCTCSWRAHTRQQVDFQDLVAVIRRVRREIEGPVGGIDYYGGSDLYDGGGLGRPSGIRHAQLLGYMINPSDGIDGEAAATAAVHAAAAQPAPAPAPANDSTLGGEDGASQSAGGIASSDASRDGGAARALQGVGVVLDETWDTAESPNFAAALQSCLDATFGMVYEQLRQKAFCRGGAGTAGGGRPHRQQERGTTTALGGAAAAVAAAAANGSEGAGGGRAASLGSSTGEGAAAAAGGSGGPAAATAGGAGFIGAPAVAEGEESAQVLATVISQAKLVVSEILEPSPQNEYAHAMAALPAVQDLCFSVFGSGSGGGVAHAPPSSGAAGAVAAAGASSLGGVGRASAVANGPGAAVAVGGEDQVEGGGGAAGGAPRAARQRAR
eukprot:g16730.t1